MPLAGEDLRLLAEIGLLAIGEGRLQEAEAIVDAVDALRPGDISVYVSRTLMALRREQPEEAVKLLRDEGMARHPDSSVLQAFLGMALLAAGYRAQAESLLQAVITRGDDEQAVSLAIGLLQPGPVE